MPCHVTEMSTNVKKLRHVVYLVNFLLMLFIIILNFNQNNIIKFETKNNTCTRLIKSEDVPPLIQMGKYEYKQLRHITDHPNYRIKCVELYKQNLYIDNVLRYVHSYNESSVLSNLHYTTSQHNVSYDSGTVLSFRIEEKINGNWSLGGSCFRSLLRGRENTVCTTEDFFNGTYRVVCPPLEYCTNLTISLRYLNFDAYTSSNNVGLDILIFELKWCPLKLDSKAVDKKYCGKHDIPLRLNGEGIWNRIHNKWSWAEAGCDIQFLEEDDSRKCLQKVKSVNILGDSHMRYISNYMMSKISTLPSNLPKWNDSSYAGINFWWSTFANVTSEKLGKLRRTLCPRGKMTSLDNLIVSAGAWDMAYYGALHFISKSGPSLVAGLSKLMKDPHWSSANIQYVNVVAFPPQNSLNHGVKAGYRTNFALAAVNYWMKTQLKPLGIQMVDAFDIVYPRYDEKVCGNHYVCYNDNGEYGYVTGSVGLTVGDVLIYNICRGDK